MREAYQSPCYPCEFNEYAVDEEFGDCLYDRCLCPDPYNLCPMAQWIREIDEKQNAQKERIQDDGSHAHEGRS